MTDYTEKSTDELLSLLNDLRENIQTNLDCEMPQSAMINIEDEREVAAELDDRGVDYDDDWSPDR